jgi:hypothetical protein
MSHEPDVQLEFVDTETLVRELLHRFDHAVFVGMNRPVDGRSEITRRWYGNSHTCCGLAHDVSMSTIDEFYEHLVDDDDDESDVVPDDDDEC